MDSERGRAPQHEDPHHQRVLIARLRTLNLLASFEDDPEIFPDGLPDDPAERARVTSLLNADVLGAVLATTYIAHYRGLAADNAREWLAEALSIFQRTVQREIPGHDVDWRKLERMAAALWDFSDDVPDGLPEDFDAEGR